mmetsp:Transcript_7872/g.17459  ORF Transcript_7872/g.17459 Transcript_7872/m.17459 type:complete len:393 (-) Transcript_7872:68-1246(-)
MASRDETSMAESQSASVSEPNGNSSKTTDNSDVQDVVMTASAKEKEAPADATTGGTTTSGTKRVAAQGAESKGGQKRRKADFDIGDSGVFYTTVSPGATNHAKRDLLHMLEAELQAMKTSKNSAPESDGANAAANVSAAGRLESELKALKEKSTTLEVCTQEVAKGTGFVKFIGDARQSKPSAVVLSILEKQREDFLSAKQAVTSRHLCRIIPIDYTCKPFPEDFKKLAETVLMPVVGPEAEPTVWALEFRSRNTSTLKKEAVLSIIDNIVPKGRHKVSLNDPVSCILVEVNPLFCGVSIVGMWAAMKKYNLQTLTTPEEKKPPPPKASATASSTAAAAETVAVASETATATKEPSVAEEKATTERCNAETPSKTECKSEGAGVVDPPPTLS